MYISVSLSLCQRDYLSVCSSLCLPAGVSVLLFLSPMLLDLAFSCLSACSKPAQGRFLGLMRSRRFRATTAAIRSHAWFNRRTELRKDALLRFSVDLNIPIPWLLACDSIKDLRLIAMRSRRVWRCDADRWSWRVEFWKPVICRSPSRPNLFPWREAPTPASFVQRRKLDLLFACLGLGDETC